jgi:ParB family transcriptional regulator, chromosome partitioning protein
LLLQVVRQSDVQKMIALVERLSRNGAVTRQQAREAVSKPRTGRPRNFTFNYRPPTKDFSLQLRFRKSQVEREEVISALERILDQLRTQQN